MLNFLTFSNFLIDPWMEISAIGVLEYVRVRARVCVGR